ncbi:MAG: DUF2071 domain-containing protein [Saprospiraceae bacterium]|nr:DUF2071 domain-containing protein [Saprospiraceae bacterium]
MKTFLKARWENIVMVNYTVDESILRPYLPYGVEIDTYQNQAFVSLVGFRFVQSTIFGLPIPYLGNFDEVNLRFYVKRTDGTELKRGVVFINELVPFKVVAFLANKLYKEHYSYAKMKSSIQVENNIKNINYSWQPKQIEYSIHASFSDSKDEIIQDSLEEFIYEHYYGFTKVNEQETWEYRVNHPRWQTNKLLNHKINCDFGEMYGQDFSFLNHQAPFSIYNAIGSEVTIDWNVNKLIK